MKKTLVAAAVLVSMGLAGCNTTKMAVAPDVPTVAVKDTRVSTDFSDEGVKLYYTSSGQLEKIEVTGHALAWKGDPTIIAESDAMDKLVKFVYGKDVDSNRRVKIINRSLERARDDSMNRHEQREGPMQYDARELDPKTEPATSAEVIPLGPVPTADTSGESRDQRASLHRQADAINETLVTAVTKIRASGRLTGVRKIKDARQDNGKIYVATYQWSSRDQAASTTVRNIMSNGR